MEDVLKIVPKYKAKELNKLVKPKRTTKKKTTEEYINELKIKNPDAIVLDEYVGSGVPIQHKFLKCGHITKISPSNALYGHGCNICCKKAKLKDTNWYLKRLKELGINNIIPLEEYKGTNIKIKHKNCDCGHEFETRPDNILSKKTFCPICRRLKAGNALKISTEEYAHKIQKNSPNIEVLSNYDGMDSIMNFHCTICDLYWSKKAEYQIYNDGCPACKKKEYIANKSLTHEEYVKRLSIVNPNIIPLEKYINMGTRILHRYVSCGHETYIIPENALRGFGCQKCVGKLLSKVKTQTQEDFVRKVEEKNKTVEIIGVYINSDTPIETKCKLCGFIWYPVANSLYQCGCPCCASSKGEKIIKEFLDINNISYNQQYRFLNCKDKRTLPFDFYLPEYNLVIEYQGRQHEKAIDYFGGEEQLDYIQSHDKIKKEYCKSNNINFFEIWHYDIKYIDTIIKNELEKLKSKSVETTGIA